MLEKDPKNEYDPNAIRVRRLNGEDLGFVPKELTGRFPYDTTFGYIHYVGQVPESGVWGALVGGLLRHITTSTSVHCKHLMLWIPG